MCLRGIRVWRGECKEYSVKQPLRAVVYYCSCAGDPAQRHIVRLVSSIGRRRSGVLAPEAITVAITRRCTLRLAGSVTVEVTTR